MGWEFYSVSHFIFRSLKATCFFRFDLIFRVFMQVQAGYFSIIQFYPAKIINDNEIL